MESKFCAPDPVGETTHFIDLGFVDCEFEIPTLKGPRDTKDFNLLSLLKHLSFVANVNTWLQPETFCLPSY